MEYSVNSAIYALLISFLASVVLCPLLIPYLTKIKFGQYIRDEGPKSHQKKAGTPTMGGLVILFSLVISAVFFINKNYDGLIVMFVTIGYAIIGFIDDYLKVVKKNNRGLKASYKMIGQIIITAVFAYYIYASSGIDTKIFIPFTDNYVDLGFMFYPFLFFVMVGTVNGVNFTDGLDGLAAGVTLLVVTFFAFVALGLNSGLLPILGAAAGSLLGFLLFNSHPARIIMGDTGSLALGGLVASTAVLLRMPLLICIVGIVYLVEELSVMLQVSWFKYTKKRYGEGKRIFRMAPLHHHFELGGTGETKIVAMFYIATAVACLVGYLASNSVF